MKVIKVEHKEIKQSFFADDATFANDGSVKSFEKLVYVITEFSKISGLNLNSKNHLYYESGHLNIVKIENSSGHLIQQKH
jgi:hypothetical protein